MHDGGTYLFCFDGHGLRIREPHLAVNGFRCNSRPVDDVAAETSGADSVFTLVGCFHQISCTVFTANRTRRSFTEAPACCYQLPRRGFYAAIDVAGQPFSVGIVPPIQSAAHAESLLRHLTAQLPLVFAAIWLFGAFVVLLVWFRRWRQVSAILRRAPRSSMAARYACCGVWRRQPAGRGKLHFDCRPN